MAKRNVFETMQLQAELYPLNASHGVEGSSEDGSYDY